MKPFATVITSFLVLLLVCSQQTTASFAPFAAVQTATKPELPNHLLYDAQQRALALLSSSRQSGFEELWGWKEKQWTRLSGTGPAARELGGAVYDTQRQRIVLYGGIGRGAEERRGDTWEWDGKRWRQMPDTSVGPRDHHALAYDEARGKTVLYSGSQSGAALATDTWEWDGAKWTQVATQGPGGRAHFGMVYDNRRKQVILFGGLDESSKKYNDLWAWDGKRWQKLGEGGPLPRYRHAMAFDRQAGVLVLYGGLGARQPPGALEDTWIWDGQHWQEIKTAGPGKRSSHLMAYDAVRGKTVLHGGNFWDGKVSTNYDDTWEWDGKQWTQIK